MTVTPGTRLGPYEILSPLGAGGMGEVYRARDTTLNRDVAIKVLPESFANDLDRLARFQREAQVLASLNHPNIAHIHGLQDGPAEAGHHVRALVMELVEGEDLAQRIARGPIPLDEALPIARQIAEALEAAHEQGIIHRDIKPANIKITPDGVVKVLDFGLAKLNAPNAPTGSNVPNDLSMSPTLGSPAMTGIGMILGTAAYMSPEQAKGREADKRSDLWSFGCVLFEMLSGTRAFEGDDVADLMVAVLSKEPAWSALPASTPAGIRILLRRCLQKDRTLRLQAAGDARVEIHDALTAPVETREPPADAIERRAVGWRRAAWFGVACALVGGVAAGVAAWNLKPAPRPSVTRLAVPLPVGDVLAVLNTPVLALSPDGSRLAFVSAREGKRRIYVRTFDGGESTPLPGTEDAESLVFSPDGKWLGFVAAGNLLKVSMAGGAPLTLCAAPNTRGVSWGDNGTIAFAPAFGTAGLSYVSAGGGQPQALTTKAQGTEEEGLRWPQLLPDSKAVLFTAWSRNIEDAQIVVQRLDTQERRVILRGGTGARYVSTGHLVYARAGTLMAVPFDLSRLEMTGDPAPVVQGVSLTTEGAAQFDVSSTGLLVYVPGEVAGTGRSMVWVNRVGTEEPLDAPSRNYVNPRIAPDGRQVAVVVQGANDDVWVYDIPRRTLTRLTFEARSLSPIWSADGKRIIYRSTRGGRLNLFRRAADGSGEVERLTDSQDNQTPQSESPDGRTVVFTTTTGRDLWILPSAGDRKPRPFFTSPFAEVGGALSPDGRWLAYTSDESGRLEIYAQPFPTGGRKVQISTDGGEQPRWVRSGELFYRNGGKVMVVELTTQPDLAVGAARMIVERPYAAGGGNSFDVTPDGQRLLMVKEGDQEATAGQISVVLHWFEELKQRVPTTR